MRSLQRLKASLLTHKLSYLKHLNLKAHVKLHAVNLSQSLTNCFHLTHELNIIANLAALLSQQI